MKKMFNLDIKGWYGVIDNRTKELIAIFPTAKAARQFRDDTWWLQWQRENAKKTPKGEK